MTRHLGPVFGLPVTDVSRFMWLMLEVNANILRTTGVVHKQPHSEELQYAYPNFIPNFDERG